MGSVDLTGVVKFLSKLYYSYLGPAGLLTVALNSVAVLRSLHF